MAGEILPHSRPLFLFRPSPIKRNSPRVMNVIYKVGHSSLNNLPFLQ